MTDMAGAVLLLAAGAVVFPLFLLLAAGDRRRLARERRADAAHAEALRQYRAAQRIYAATSMAREQMYAEARRYIEPDPRR